MGMKDCSEEEAWSHCSPEGKVDSVLETRCLFLSNFVRNLGEDSRNGREVKASGEKLHARETDKI